MEKIKKLFGMGSSEPRENKPHPIDREELQARRQAFARLLSSNYASPIVPPEEMFWGKPKRPPRFILGTATREGESRTVALVAEQDRDGRVVVDAPSLRAIEKVLDEARSLDVDDELVDIYGVFGEHLQELARQRFGDIRLLGLTDLQIVSLLGPLATEDPATNRERLVEVIARIGHLPDGYAADGLAVEARHRIYTERLQKPFLPSPLPPSLAIECVRKLARNCDQKGAHLAQEDHLLGARRTLASIAMDGQDGDTLAICALEIVGANDDWTMLQDALNAGATIAPELVDRAMAADNAEEYLVPLLAANKGPDLPGNPIASALEVDNFNAACDLLRAGVRVDPNQPHPVFCLLGKSGQGREVLDAFIAAGLDPDMRDRTGATLLDVAIANKSPLVEPLLWAGANVDLPLRDGSTARQKLNLDDRKPRLVGAPMSQEQSDKQAQWAKKAGRPVVGPMVIEPPKRPNHGPTLPGQTNKPAQKQNGPGFGMQ